MTVRFRIQGPSRSEIDRWAKRNLEVAKRAVTAGVTEATEGLKLELRQHVSSAGLGNRLPNAVRSQVYPKGRASLRAAGEVFIDSKKGIRIFDAMLNGATIRGSGGKYLAIPTKNVPRHGRGGMQRMTPEDVARLYGPLRSIPTGSAKAPFILVAQAIRARNDRAERTATGRRKAQGRAERPVAMFVLVKEVRQTRKLDPDAIVDRWGGRIGQFIEKALPVEI